MQFSRVSAVLAASVTSLAAFPAAAALSVAPGDMLNQIQLWTYSTGSVANFTSGPNLAVQAGAYLTRGSITTSVTADTIVVNTAINADGYEQPTAFLGASAQALTELYFTVDVPTLLYVNYSMDSVVSDSITGHISRVRVYSSSQTYLDFLGFGNGYAQFTAVPGVYYTVASSQNTGVLGQFNSDGPGSEYRTLRLSVSSVPSPAAASLAAIATLAGLRRRR